MLVVVPSACRILLTVANRVGLVSARLWIEINTTDKAIKALLVPFVTTGGGKKQSAFYQCQWCDETWLTQEANCNKAPICQPAPDLTSSIQVDIRVIWKRYDTTNRTGTESTRGTFVKVDTLSLNIVWGSCFYYVGFGLLLTLQHKWLYFPCHPKTLGVMNFWFKVNVLKVFLWKEDQDLMVHIKPFYCCKP